MKELTLLMLSDILLPYLTPIAFVFGSILIADRVIGLILDSFRGSKKYRSV